MGKGCLGGVFGGNINPLDTFPLGSQHHGQHAGHPPHRAVQGNLPQKGAVQPGLAHLTVGSQNGKQDRQVKVGAALFQAGRCQIHGNAAVGEGDTAAFGGGTNPLPCFFHGGIRQPHNVKAGKAIGNIGLRRDEISPDSVDAHGTNAANHVFPPLLCTVSILQETAEKYNPPI